MSVSKGPFAHQALATTRYHGPLVVGAVVNGRRNSSDFLPQGQYHGIPT